MTERTREDPTGPAVGRRALARRPSNAREETPGGARMVRRLLDAGLVVFARRGYLAARVDDITVAADVSHGTFYLYFKNKEALLHRLARECAAELDTLIVALSSLSTTLDEESLSQWLRDFVRVYQRYGPVVRIWFEAHDPDALMQSMADNVFEGLMTGLEQLVRHRLPAGADPAVASLAAVGMLERVSYYLTSHPEVFDEEAIIAVLYRMFAGLTFPAAGTR
ncbi:TetR/AcrR family transcriptional regulator [Frankia sp. AgB1.9]|uniref:TetR/AcrR family transcriptional regulator n=1 Tax=unclassified Frankia TaxID=2632575 RepID=UPI0019341E53|nr:MULTISPECIES: TetR/AcrR family transcriptional regulator [unclassified Frankia]MBL7488103.1 TetR/AcrR family transcriptional regulator [Frankia sp. AgW1.1]MBL7553261.1 TetR/AcrR family transcriptional regulator [Frankia sp. AgB1.9]MBL7624239.1 TetR/AcrR family transcriptional regulator [Frankia sp. AgB1.8]